MTEKQVIGKIGEEAACRYLENKGYRVVKTNFLCKTGEIDIICLKDGCTVFVEVKTRKNSNYGSAAEFVDFRKQQKVKRAAMYYIKNADADMRFDVVEVYHNGGKITEINHIENAF